MKSDNMTETDASKKPPQKSTSDTDEENHKLDVHPRRPSMMAMEDLPEFITYKCVKTKPSTFSRTRHFQLTQGEKELYHTKLKSHSQTEPIPVARGNTVHYRNKNPYYILTNKDHEAFSLRKDSPTGNELMLVNFYQIISADEPKNIQVKFTSPPGSVSPRIVSQKPTRNANGEWILDFSDRILLPSLKNAILINEVTKEQVVVVRKTAVDTLELDCLTNIDPLLVFGIAMAMWASPK